MVDVGFFQAFLYVVLNRDLIMITWAGLTFLIIFMTVLRILKKWSD